MVTDTPLAFHLSCDKKDSGRSKVEPPFGFLTLHKSCKATCDYFSLMGYFEGSTNKVLDNPASVMLKEYNITDIHVWNDINVVVPYGNMSVKLPPKLSNLEDFPLGNLKLDLEHEEHIEPMKIEHFPSWVSVAIFVLIGLILILLMVCFCKHKSQISKFLLCLNRKKPRTDRVIANVRRSETRELEEQSTPLTEIVVPTDIIKNKFKTLDKK